MQRVIEAIAAGLGNSDIAGARRLFHGRGQCYEGLGFINVDWFEPVLLLTLYQAPSDEAWRQLKEGLAQFESKSAALLVQHRYQRGAPMDVLWGQLPEQPLAHEQDLAFALSFGGKQNFGFFLDMAPGRSWLQARASNARVLNLFAYTCAFSVVAMAAGAKSVVNVDMSRAALEVGRDNHRLNQQQSHLARDVQFLPYDLFRSWKKIINKGPYDIVIIDPPSRQKGSFMADKDYAKVLRRLPALMAEGGDILACLNAPELDEGFLIAQLAEHCPQAVLKARLENRSDFPERDRGRSLKMLHYRMPAQAEAADMPRG